MTALAPTTAPASDPTAPSGLEQLRAFFEGPPRPGVGSLLGMQVAWLDEGRVAFTYVALAEHTNPMGTLHGGITSTLLDSAMGCAVHSTLPPGWAYTTLDLSVRLTRAVRPGSGTLLAEGTVVHRGRRSATAEGRLTDEDGRLVAHATTGCILLPPGS